MTAAALRVLVSGVVLGQPMGGVRRHNAELLPRVARALHAAGGGLTLLEGREPVAFDLPPEVARIAADVPARPAPLRAVREREALERVLAADQRFDLVHVAHLPTPRGLRVPFTLTIHDLRSIDHGRAPFVRRLFGRHVIGRALKDAARVIVVSEAVKARLAEAFGVAMDRVDVVPNASDHLEFVARNPAAEPFLLHVGHLEPRKNLALLVRALALDSGLPRLVFAGAAKGDEDRRILTLARELGVAGRVEVRGAVDDRELVELYASAAAVVIPSVLEGFGIPAIEAEAAGVPLAISAIPALLEVAGSGVPSFAPEDASECARAIRRACETGRDELALRQARVREWSWDRSAGLWVEAWERAVTRGG